MKWFLIFLLAAAASAPADTGATAGELERGIIFECYLRGVRTWSQMRHCSGLDVPPPVLRSCLNGGPCFERMRNTAPVILPFPGRDPFADDDVVNLPRKDPFADDDKRPFGSAQEVGRACAEEIGIDNVPAFTACTGRRVILSESQQKFVQCAEENSGGSTRRFVTCALDSQLSDDQRAAAECAMQSEGDSDEFLNCAADQFLNEELTDEQQAAVECALDSGGDAESFASCAATEILGGRATPEQQAAIECAAESQGDATSFAACAGSKMLGAGLNPEQRIAVQCVAETGAQPYAAAACIAVRLTQRELQKCVEGDFGGDGCFGDNNDLVGKNGWTMRTLSNAVSDVIYGPGQNHDLFGRKGWLGRTLENVRSDVENGVSENNDVLGKKGWACQRLGCENWSPF